MECAYGNGMDRDLKLVKNILGLGLDRFQPDLATHARGLRDRLGGRSRTT
jgi:hypothetical protein